MPSSRFGELLAVAALLARKVATIDTGVRMGVWKVVQILLIFCKDVYTSQNWVWLQIPGLIGLGIGCVFALYGYIGILAYRMQNAFSLSNAHRDKDKQSNRQD